MIDNIYNDQALTILIKPISSKCNLKCDYCFYLDVAENREIYDFGIISMETTNILLKKLFSLPFGTISFVFQGGEPLLVGIDYYLDFMKIVKKLNFYNALVNYSIQTNGTLISEDFAQLFFEYNWLVGVSLDGDRRIHNKYRKYANNTGSYIEVMEGIELLRKKRVQYNIISVVNSDNFRYIKHTYKFFKKNGFRFLQFIPCLDIQTSDSQLVLTSKQMYQFLAELFDEWYFDFKNGKYISIRLFDNYINLLNGHGAGSCEYNGICGRYIVCESDGSLYPCDYYCLDSNLLGNIHDDNITDILKGSKYRKFISESYIIHKKCRNCSYYNLCRGGCKKNHILDFSSNKYCDAYFNFFKKNLEKLEEIAISVRVVKSKNNR